MLTQARKEDKQSAKKLKELQDFKSKMTPVNVDSGMEPMEPTRSAEKNKPSKIEPLLELIRKEVSLHLCKVAQ